MPLVLADAPTEQVATVLDERGQLRVDEVRDDADLRDHQLAPALLELVERGDAAVFPVGEVAVVKPVD